MTDESVPPRLALARLARDAVERMQGVGLVTGRHPRWSTPDGEQTIQGMTAVAGADGRYELELHIVVSWPPAPLAQLADDLRRRVWTAAERSHLDDPARPGADHRRVDPGA